MVSVRTSEAGRQVWMPEMDTEHAELYRTAEQLRARVREGALLRTMKPLLDELIGEAQEHFTHEEKRMRETRYPMAAWHRKQHETVRRKIEDAARRVSEGDREAIEPALDFLCNWLRDHIAVADRMMAAYLRNQDRGRARRARA